MIRVVQPDRSGVGIEFVKITEANRAGLDRLIADLTQGSISVI